ncbi:hypothetical protein BH18ACT3_BH18ACT3_21500 [soil metagenome]|jgi:hypothetical protein
MQLDSTYWNTATRLLPSAAVATNPPLDLVLSPINGEARPLSEWLTTFHLASVVLDPFTNESSWILSTAARILDGFREADVRTNFVVTADEDDARAFVGPLAERFLIFADRDRAIVKAIGLDELPAFVFLRVDGTVPAVAEGWDAVAWRNVAEEIARTTSWMYPTIPAPGDPGPFRGTPALA